LYEKEGDYWKDLKINFEKLGKIKDNTNSEIYYVIFPSLGYLNENHPYLDIYEQVIFEAEKNGLKSINLFNALKGEDGTKLRANIYDNVHTNKDGNKIVAEYLVNKYIDNRI